MAIFQVTTPFREIKELGLPAKRGMWDVWFVINQLKDAEYLIMKHENGVEWFTFEYEWLGAQLDPFTLAENTVRKYVNDLCKLQILRRHKDNKGARELWFGWDEAHHKLRTQIAQNRMEVQGMKASKREKKVDKKISRGRDKNIEVAGEGRDKNIEVADSLYTNNITNNVYYNSTDNNKELFLRSELEFLGVTQNIIQKIIEQLPQKEIEQTIEEAKKSIEKNKPSNPGGYTVAIFKKKYSKQE